MESSERTERGDALRPPPIPEEIGAPIGLPAPDDDGEMRPLTRREANARTEPVGSRRSRRMRGTAQVLAFAGALLFAIAAWLPWAIATGTDAGNPVASPVQLPLDPGSIGAPPLPSFYSLGAAFVVWSTLCILGILLAALLWLGAGKVSAFLTWLAYTTWLLLASYTAARSAVALLGADGGSLRLAPGAGPESVVVQGVQLGIGIPLAAAALVLAWIGDILVLAAGARGLRHARVFAGAASAPHALSRWLVLSGLAGWVIGFFEMPWLSADCGNPVLVGGSCAGVRVTDLLGHALGDALTTPLPGSASGLFVAIDPRAALYAIPTALLGAALLLAIAAWRRAGTPAVYIWAALWLLAASGCAILARSAAQQAVSGAPTPGLAAGAWQAAQGIYVTLGSLVLVLLGLAAHWLSPVFSRNHAAQVA
jgi:hypothetical protein